MRRSATRLTRTLVERARPAPGDRFLWDAEVCGFGLKITPRGFRTYVLQYRFEGRARRYSIGGHGAPWTVETARARARSLLAAVRAGRDPQAEKAQARKALTVSELGELFLREGLEGRGESWTRRVKGGFENHIGPVLGARLAHQVAPAEIDALFRSVAHGATARPAPSQVRGGPQAANMAQDAVSAAFSFAVRRGLVPDTPARGVRRFPKRRVERFLAPEEYARLGRVLAAADAFSCVNRSAVALIRLVLLSGVSPGHARRLTGRDFQPGRGRLSYVAAGRARIVWLGAPALALVSRLPAAAGEGPLFPGRGEGRPLSRVQAVWARIRQAADLADVRLLDLRHSFAALGASSGEDPRVVGRLVNLGAESMGRYPAVPEAPVKAAAERISGEISRLLSELPQPPRSPRPDEARLVADALLAGAPAARCLDLETAARRAGLTPKTLVDYSGMGLGPPYRRVGGRMVYPQAELELWIERRGGPRRPRPGRGC